MTLNFNIAKIPKIFFGQGKFLEIGNILNNFGKKTLIVTGAKSLQASGKLDDLFVILKSCSITYSHHIIKGEPSPDFIDKIVKDSINEKPAVVLAIGGGSVIDAGKAISAMLPSCDSVKNYLEGVGSKIHKGGKIPFIAIPTTSGTGSEATKNAVLSQIGENGFKKSLRHDNFIPDIAIIDPKLMINSPANITAACGLDAFTQLLESYVSTKASPLTDALAYKGIELIRDSLLPACTSEAKNIQIRSKMAMGSLLSGITLANAGLGIIHGFASSIGGLFDISHGVICGTLLPTAIKMNIQCLLNKTDSSGIALKKYANIGKLLSGKTNKDIQQYCDYLIEEINGWIGGLNIPLLSEYGIKHNDISTIISLTNNKNNPIKLNYEQMGDILAERI